MSFAALLDYYANSHRHPLNKMLHAVGIPCVLFATLQFFSWIHISMPGLFDIHISWLFYGALITYYARLDGQSALFVGVAMLPFVWFANVFSAYWLSFFLFCLLFAAGWILQVLGHIIEGHRPAFISRPSILPLLPLLVLAESMREQGYRKDLQQAELEEPTA